ncbi:YhcN/YlaJ family sporulation lipoprotein [Sutcliffiella deserti]|uniref:YhcN/YlaJ family sporulation lipoprotein n=1 Tax=Sutcliffiella deserti TaxID=2875501 RepID=UPI001CBD2C45|nr:YhcN/YlaJ family sporulation lipoprotein [Sutcliffiella deserti]
MRKSVVAITSASLLLCGLTGCGTGNSAEDNRYYEETTPIGYYTSEDNPNVNNNRNHRTNKERGNTFRVTDNDGPVNEILDRSVINGERNKKQTTRNNPLSTRENRTETNEYERGFNYRRSDINYHRHLNDIGTAKPSFYNNYQGRLTERLTERAQQVDGVEDARAVVYGNDILIAIEPGNNRREQMVTNDVRRAVQPLTNGKECRVVVNQGTYNTVRQFDNELRDGGPVDDLNEDIRNLMNTFTPGR